jgi:hypothetical protein
LFRWKNSYLTNESPSSSLPPPAERAGRVLDAFLKKEKAEK